MLEAKQYARAYSRFGFGELNEDDQYIINFLTTENFNYDYKHLGPVWKHETKTLNLKVKVIHFHMQFGRQNHLL